MAFLSPFNVSSRSSRRRAHPPRCAAAGAQNSASEGADNSARPDVAARRLARVRLFRQLDELQHSLNVAVNRERFADAARLRDEIASLRLSDEYCRTEMDLVSAVKEERFVDAARLRDALHELEPPPSLMREYEKVVRADDGQRRGDVLSNVSVTNSHRISVRAEGYYIPEQSVPEHNRFLFGYKIVIANESEHVCQLVSRHWIISSDGNADSHVKGAGVVGRQPVLMPGESFEYTSACPISVPLRPGQSVVGSLRGHYIFCRGDTGNIRFMVNVDPFHFELPFRHMRPS